MYKHILIPLDGSSYSESAIPYSIKIAGYMKSRITLLHIIEKNPPENVHGERHLKKHDEAVEYLENLRKERYPAEMDVDFHVHEEDEKGVVKDIAAHHDEISSDLVVMTTHGWGGVREIFFGNTAGQVLKLGTMPVLFIPPSLGKNPAVNWPERILVPLDGKTEHEAGYDTAVSISIACRSRLYMALIVPTPLTLSAKESAVSILLPGATREMLDMHEAEARNYLELKKSEAGRFGLDSEIVICRGDPAEGIGNLTDSENIDLIVMGTHGRTGLSAFWSGSVGAKISNMAKASILFVPVA